MTERLLAAAQHHSLEKTGTGDGVTGTLESEDPHEEVNVGYKDLQCNECMRQVRTGFLARPFSHADTSWQKKTDSNTSDCRRSSWPAIPGPTS